ncbi:MAG: hypothetical protein KF767_00775 [Bdellovibrionaceae bacterium]|nr:hypothetical protein [Pseudobdellovibrionaceae bacterium]
MVFSEEYKVTSFMVNLRGRAGLYTILNLVQDIGWQHAMKMGVQLPKGQGWVFTRQKLVMTDWPKYKDNVTLRTWLREPGGNPFLLRDYEIFVGDRKLGECTSTFTVFDTTTRKMVAGDWSRFPSVWQTEGTLPHVPGKIAIATDTEDLAQFEVRNSDIDLNNHVNNTRYAQWVLDAIPIEILRQGAHLVGYEVNFLSEMKIGDVVHLQKAKAEESDGDRQRIQFQGTRAADGKVAFTAVLTTLPESPTV